jgi:type VI secretion system protein ImpK
MPGQSAALAAQSRAENLALLFQEPLTAIVRLRSGRQALTQADTFRTQMREALKSAAQAARNQAGYSTEDVKMATLAIVGFLDESVLMIRNPLFADWPRKPLQEELFGSHMAGEIFYQDLEQLLSRNDAPDLADVLEIHYLCLLLGFRGRYSGRGAGEVQGIMSAVENKIRRIRGGLGELSPSWAPAGQVTKIVGDPWVRWLMVSFAVSLFLVLTLFAVFKISLSSATQSTGGAAVQRKV